MRTSSFNMTEANEMLQLSYAVDLLGPMTKVADNTNYPPDTDGNRPPIRDLGSTAQIAPVNAPNPLYSDNKTFYNYPTTVWPEGWVPAISLKAIGDDNVPAESETGIPKINQWALSRVTSFIPNWFEKNQEGANCVIAAKKAGTSTYAIAFAGTENAIGGIEDALIIPVPTDPLKKGTKIGWGKIGFTLPEDLGGNYTISVAPYNTPDNATDEQPPLVPSTMHFGFRFGLETMMTVFTTRTFYTLKTMLSNLERVAELNGEKEIDLLITGHSLGGALAGVFSTWFLANNPFKNVKVNLKTYTFASPKIGNDIFSYKYDLAYTNYGRSYRIANCLDTIPQVPFTIQGLKSLNNPEMIEMLANMSPLLGKILKLLFGYRLPLNFCHVGSPVIIPGEFPIVWDKTTYPPEWSAEGQAAHSIPAASLKLTQQWWQHWPGNYADALNRLTIGSESVSNKTPAAELI